MTPKLMMDRKRQWMPLGSSADSSSMADPGHMGVGSGSKLPMCQRNNTLVDPACLPILSYLPEVILLILAVE